MHAVPASSSLFAHLDYGQRSTTTTDSHRKQLLRCAPHWGDGYPSCSCGSPHVLLLLMECSTRMWQGPGLCATAGFTEAKIKPGEFGFQPSREHRAAGVANVRQTKVLWALHPIPGKRADLVAAPAELPGVRPGSWPAPRQAQEQRSRRCSSSRMAASAYQAFAASGGKGVHVCLKVLGGGWQGCFCRGAETGLQRKAHFRLLVFKVFVMKKWKHYLWNWSKTEYCQERSSEISLVFFY